MPAETGFPRADVADEFLRARRRQALARLVRWLRRAPDDVNVILSLDEVLDALGRRGERRLGLQTIRLDSIVGTVDSSDFDRRFRPTSRRVPAMAKITVTDPWSYAELGEAVEAWGYRRMQDTGQFSDRVETARHWYGEEYQPVVRMLRAADLIGTRTEAEAYLLVAAERYRLILAHEWSDEIVERLRGMVE